MNVRRLNDILKIVGAVVGALGVFGPVFAKPHASVGALIGELLTMLPGALGIFAAGMGTRGIGQEYNDVAEAKAIAKVASIAPPPTLQ